MKKNNMEPTCKFEVIKKDKKKTSLRGIIGETEETGFTEFEFKEETAKVTFFDVGAIVKAKCFIYNKNTDELMAQCKLSETILLHIQEPVEIRVHVKGYLGNPEILLSPGDNIDVCNNWTGKIYISNERQVYMNWLQSIETAKVVDIFDSGKNITLSKSGVSTAARAALGGALIGDLGVLAGAASGKSKIIVNNGKRKYKFYVSYADGTDDMLILEEGVKCNDLIRISYRNKTNEER